MKRVNSFMSRVVYRFHTIRILLVRRRLSTRKVWTFFWNSLLFRFGRNPGTFHPSIVFIEPSSLCNLSCKGCLDTRKLCYPDGLGSLDYAIFERVLPEIKNHALLVCLYWEGEPLVHKEIGRMVGELHRNRVASMLATNGNLLTPERSRMLVDAGMDIMKIAISGITQEGHERYHRKGNLEELLSNIDSLMGYIHEKKAPTFVLIDYLLFPFNQDELDGTREYFRKKGYRNCHFNVRNAYDVPEAKTVEDLTSYGEPVNERCGWPWSVAVVNWKGDVYPCCYVGAISGSLIMGNLHDSSLGEILNGEKYRDLRRQHLESPRSDIRVCKNCYYKNLDFQ